MSNPVDLTNLREITDGDAEMEAELFAEFIKTSEDYVNQLGDLLDDSKSEDWRTVAHAFKGLSLNLGAAKLGELCKIAQENNTSSSAEKTKMLDAIKKEYAAVNGYLENL